MGVTGSFCTGIVWEYSESTPHCASNRQTFHRLGEAQEGNNAFQTALDEALWVVPAGQYAGCPWLNNLLLLFVVVVVLFFLSK